MRGSKGVRRPWLAGTWLLHPRRAHPRVNPLILGTFYVVAGETWLPWFFPQPTHGVNGGK